MKDKMKELVKQFESGLMTIDELYNRLMLLEVTWTEDEAEGNSFNMCINSEGNLLEIISDVDNIVATCELNEEDYAWMQGQDVVVEV